MLQPDETGTPGGVHAAPGVPVSSGCSIVDHKTAASITYANTKGYSMHGQFLTNAMIFKRTMEPQWGPLAGVIVSLVAKHKKITDESFFRVHSCIEPSLIDEFEHKEVIPWMTQLYTKLADADRDNIHHWPKCHAACVGQYGPCEYFDICEAAVGHEEGVIDMMYMSDPARIKNVKDFVEPDRKPTEKETINADGVNGAMDKKSQTKFERDALRTAAEAAFVSAVSSYDIFKPETVFAESTNKKTVKKLLADALQGAWDVGMEFEIPVEYINWDLQRTETAITYTKTAKGFSWAAAEKKKRGSWTFSSLANVISKDWWDPSKHGVSPA